MAVAIPNQIKWQEPTIELDRIAILNRLLMEANTTIDALVTAINATEKDGDDIIKVTLNLLQRDWQKKADELAGILNTPKLDYSIYMKKFMDDPLAGLSMVKVDD